LNLIHLIQSCSPDAGFWSIIGVTGAVIMALCVWVFLRRNANKPPRLDEQATDTEAPTDQEAYGLIPKSKGLLDPLGVGTKAFI
jgi:hypothetical protein